MAEAALLEAVQRLTAIQAQLAEERARDRARPREEETPAQEKLPRPASFDGRQASWKPWSFKFMAWWTALKESHRRDDLEWARSRQDPLGEDDYTARIAAVAGDDAEEGDV